MSSKIQRLLDFLPYLMAVTSAAVSRRIANQYEAASGLRIPEWRVMAVLGDGGSMTQRDLVGETLMDKVAVNRACKALEERDLIRRSPNALDGRSHHLELTDTGREMYDRVMDIALDSECEIYSVLDDAERAQLKALLTRLRERVIAMGESA
jgi:DNA-binding MarR family transcriptional regulator